MVDTAVINSQSCGAGGAGVGGVRKRRSDFIEGLQAARTAGLFEGLHYAVGQPSHVELVQRSVLTENAYHRKVREKMVKGISKNCGLMLARDHTRFSVFPQTARTGGEKQVALDQRPGVNLRGAALETPGNLWSVAPPGHYHRDGCRLRLTRPHVLEATCGAATAVGLQDTQPRGCHLQVS